MKPVALVCSEPIRPCMGGIGIRYLEFARRLPAFGLDVVLLSPGDPDDVPDVPFPRARVQRAQAATLPAQLAACGCVVAQGQLANDLAAAGIPHPLVVDLYDPFLIENLHYAPTLGPGVFRSDLASWRLQLARGDFFLCASEEQRLYYLGFLTALGRVNPGRVAGDPLLRGLIDAVPFGTAPASAAHRPVLPPRADGEKRILFGGVYDWYDPWTLLRALESADRPEWTVLFMRHPSPDVTPQEAMRAIEAWAGSREGRSPGVRFCDWVEADRRFDLLRDVDVLVAPHVAGIETDLALRTRVIDALAAGCPVVASRGGAMSRALEEEDAGWVVPPGDPAAMLAAVASVLDSAGESAARRVAGQAAAARRFGWERVLEPLVRFCRNPVRDHAAASSVAPAGPSRPTFSVVIPTRNRCASLAEVLAALGRQEAPPSFEVVVVDDGSTDGTAARIESTRFPNLDLRVVRQDHGGPARARNGGVQAAHGAYVAFLGDDTVPAGGWLAAHAAAHRARPGRAPLAVLGHIDWHPAVGATAFLRYINSCGLQFGYGIIEAPEDLPFAFFYGSNVSLPRELVLAEPFATGFTGAAWEDTELGYRLKTRRGLSLVYEPAALALHRHATSFASFAQRQWRVGRAAATFYRLHPELGPFVGLAPDGPPPLPPPWPVRRQTLAIRLLEHLGVALPGLWQSVLRYHYVRGLHQGWREASG